MTVVQTSLPQRRACDCVKLDTLDLVREHRSSERDVRLQNMREAMLLVRGRLAEMKRAGNIRRAVKVLRTRVIQVHRRRRELRAVAALGAIVNNRAVRTNRGDSVKAQGHIVRHLGAERFLLVSNLDFVPLVRSAAGHLVVEPAEELDERCAVANMRLAHSLDLHATLDRLLRHHYRCLFLAIRWRNRQENSNVALQRIDENLLVGVRRCERRDVSKYIGVWLALDTTDMKVLLHFVQVGGIEVQRRVVHRHDGIRNAV